MRATARRLFFALFVLALAPALGCGAIPVHRFSAKKNRDRAPDAGQGTEGALPPDAGGAADPGPAPEPEVPAAAPRDEAVAHIPAGTVWLGHEPKARTHLPRRSVKTGAFALDRREVTAGAYAACVRAGRCTAAKTEAGCTGADPTKSEHPINCVTWEQAAAYCAAEGARLPTEVEWERAARGLDGRPFPWGDVWPPPANTGNFADESARAMLPFWIVIPGYSDAFPMTAPVGSFPAGATPEGVHDLAGNVLEWTADLFSAAFRVVRGSSFGHARRAEIATYHRVGYRAEATSIHIGFRCVR